MKKTLRVYLSGWRVRHYKIDEDEHESFEVLPDRTIKVHTRKYDAIFFNAIGYETK